MAGKHGKKNAKGEVIVKKYEIVEGGHHGGAWKVAYADFVTAMMAFFLLMWLLNATTEDQRKGLADYFSPNSLDCLTRSSGTGAAVRRPYRVRRRRLGVRSWGSADHPRASSRWLSEPKMATIPVFTEAHRAISGEGVGKGPVADDQDVDDTDEKPLGQKETRPAPALAVHRSSSAKANRPIRAVTPAEIAAEKDRQEKAAFEQCRGRN